MMEIIAHRGFWLDVHKQNTREAFEMALSNGFGIETDVRDHNGQLVISHDMPNDNSMTFCTFLDICREYDSSLLLALNIKADGLQSDLKSSGINNKHFYFDMSVPDMLGYLKSDMNFYSRYSEIELSPSLYSQCSGVWLDNFVDDVLNVDALKQFLCDDKKVILVSPELHKRDESTYWETLKAFLKDNAHYSDKIGLCTDFPFKARDKFYGN